MLALTVLGIKHRLRKKKSWKLDLTNITDKGGLLACWHIIEKSFKAAVGCIGIQ